MADIKTRDTSKGTIKTINKAAVATERMKKAYVMTKDKAEHSTNASENSAEEYASDKIEAATDRAVHETAYRADKVGRFLTVYLICLKNKISIIFEEHFSKI